MTEMLISVLSLGVATFLLGLIILWASKKFHVEQNPLVDTVISMLPGANCGACGQPGCAQFAEVLVRDRDPSLVCPVGGNDLSYELGRILGIKMEEAKPVVCVALCFGSKKTTKFLAEYKGIEDCWAAKQIMPGLKQCEYGCLGLGSCLDSCTYGALSIKDGLVQVDGNLCIGCGACITQCPNDVLKLVEKKEKKYLVACQSKDKGAVTRKYCSNGCIACGLCLKVCKYDAIKIENFCAVIDDAKCACCGECVKVCPVKCIHLLEYDMKGVARLEGEANKPCPDCALNCPKNLGEK